MVFHGFSTAYLRLCRMYLAALLPALIPRRRRLPLLGPIQIPMERPFFSVVQGVLLLLQPLYSGLVIHCHPWHAAAFWKMIHNHFHDSSWICRSKSSPIWRFLPRGPLSHGLCLRNDGQRFCHDHGLRCTHVLLDQLGGYGGFLSHRGDPKSSIYGFSMDHPAIGDPPYGHKPRFLGYLRARGCTAGGKTTRTSRISYLSQSYLSSHPPKMSMEVRQLNIGVRIPQCAFSIVLRQKQRGSKVNAPHHGWTFFFGRN